MIALYISLYLLTGIIAIVLTAYDSFSKTFDWGLSDGWEFFWYQRYLIWLIILIVGPYALIREVNKKIKDRKFVKEWRDKGRFTRKL